MRNFFFDTADVVNLKRVWNDIKNNIDSYAFAGITTNPAIFQRVNKNSLREWLDTLKELVEFLSIEQKGSILRQIHVQFPNSDFSKEELLDFEGLLRDELDYARGTWSLGIKIPPYTKALVAARRLQNSTRINVTGCAEAGTILKVGDGAHFVSIIPGRMLQVGLEYKEHLAFATQNTSACIIAGALRDAEQVADAFMLGAIPTIGLKTWDLILKEKKLDYLLNLSYPSVQAPEFMPPVDQKHTQLSLDFFKEMDQYGAQAYNDFKNLTL